MQTIDILSAFLKGNEVANISQKQKNWLIAQAQKEGKNFSTAPDTIYFEDCFYTIKHCKRLASGGSYVGTAIVQGHYKLEKKYCIQFESTGLVTVASKTDLDYYKTTEHKFRIIAPKK